MIGAKLVISGVLGAALLVAPSIANAEPKEDMAKTVEKLEGVVKKLETVEKGLTDYKTSNATAVRQLQEDVEALKSKVRQIEEDVKLIRQFVTNPSSTSRREATETAPKMGRLKLANEYLEEMSVAVNGVSYRLLPGQTRTINVPAGTFTYQVLQLQASAQVRSIAPDEEKPIRIFTQR